ncbi:MAG: hypothetical protein WCT40_02605 [Candidatus Magasanikbacteria bacterium]|jgi:hypothetical protein
MLEIRYSELSLSEIKNFIHSYEEGFFVLYRDSGLWAEDIIVEQYHQTAKRLSERIFSGIEKHLSPMKVLGRKEQGRWNELSFYIGDRLIIVYYSDDNKNNTRLIESIGIDRKPIIF